MHKFKIYFEKIKLSSSIDLTHNRLLQTGQSNNFDFKNSRNLYYYSKELVLKQIKIPQAP
jgi:hypothetical protein